MMPTAPPPVRVVGPAAVFNGELAPAATMLDVLEIAVSDALDRMANEIGIPRELLR